MQRRGQQLCNSWPVSQMSFKMCTFSSVCYSLKQVTASIIFFPIYGNGLWCNTYSVKEVDTLENRMNREGSEIIVYPVIGTDSSCKRIAIRSEERRVGKEC